MSSVVHVSDEEEDVEFEQEEDMEEEEEEEKPEPKRKEKNSKPKMKGRGFRGKYDETENRDRYSGKGGKFDSVRSEGEKDVQKSVEGYIVFIRNVHEEAQEDDLYDMFADYGEIQQLHLNLDRRTGYVKGYSLIEYSEYDEAAGAIENLDGVELLEQKIQVSWAFKPSSGGGGGRGSRNGRGDRRERRRKDSDYDD